MANDGGVLQRRWVQLKEAVGRPISVFQFNVLADFQSDDFPFCHQPEVALVWNFRGPKLIQACLQADADIICMEECDHFADFFEPKLKELGYSGVFQKKSAADAPDGTAVFFRNSVLNLLDQSTTPLEGSQNAFFLHLQYSASADAQPRTVYIAATHLKAKAGNEVKRQHQGRLLLAGLADFIAAGQALDAADPHYGVVACGDFNDEPDSLVVAEFNTASRVQDSISDDASRFPVPLTSALDLYPPPASAEDAIFTTFKMRKVGHEQKRIIDYIFFSNTTMSAQALLSMPTLNDLPHRLPCPNYPSDHLAIAVKLNFSQ